MTIDHVVMPSDEHRYLTGRLLVAMPGIEDPRFERAVVFLCAHDETHAMGLTVNRPVEGLTVAKLMAKLKVKAPAKPMDELWAGRWSRNAGSFCIRMIIPPIRPA